jgi:hypothetical protein
MTIKNTLVDNRTRRFPFPASTAVSIGDLLYWDRTNYQAKPLTSLATGASEQADQATVGPIFLGVALDVRLSNEADANAIRTVGLDGIYEVDVVSFTPQPGDLLAPTWNGGSALVNQVLKKTANLADAIAVVVDIPTQTGNATPWNAAATKVIARIQSRVNWDLALADMAGVPHVNAAWQQDAGSAPSAGSQTFFLADRNYRITGVSTVFGTASTSGTVTVNKDSGTSAPGAGTAVLTGAMSLAGTANTVVNGTLVATQATLQLAAGDRLSITLAGTLTSLAEAIVSVGLQPI